MNVLDSARVLIYRINKKGLEIFLVQSSHKDTKENWQIPSGAISSQHTNYLNDSEKMIELDPVAEGGAVHQALAIECDWHEIPSIRAMIKEDVRIVKDQIKQRFPELEGGTYFAVKEAFKRVLPHEYAMIKELKDVVFDRNQAKYI